METKKNEVKRYRVVLTFEQREHLLEIIKKGGLSAQEINRALILLHCDKGEGGPPEKPTNKQVADFLGVGERTVERAKGSFLKNGIESAVKNKPPDRVYQRKIDGDAEAQLIVLCCSEPPEGHCCWSLRMLAAEMVELNIVDEVSYETVRRTLKKTN